MTGLRDRTFRTTYGNFWRAHLATSCKIVGAFAQNYHKWGEKYGLQDRSLFTERALKSALQASTASKSLSATDTCRLSHQHTKSQKVCDHYGIEPFNYAQHFHSPEVCVYFTKRGAVVVLLERG